MSRVCALVTHNDPAVTSDAVGKVFELAKATGVGVWASDDEIARHGLDPAVPRRLVRMFGSASEAMEPS